MGIGFVLFWWLIILAVLEIIFLPLTIIGIKKYLKLGNKKWLILCSPAISVVVIPVLVIIIGALNFSLFGDHGPNRSPSKDEIIGKYYLTGKSRIFLEKEKNYRQFPDSIMIIFDSSGSLNMINIPDCILNGFGKGNGNFETKTDYWKIEKSNRFYSWFYGWPIGNRITLTGNYPKYKIHINFGDPDSDEDIEFEKK